MCGKLAESSVHLTQNDWTCIAPKAQLENTENLGLPRTVQNENNVGKVTAQHPSASWADSSSLWQDTELCRLILMPTGHGQL